MIDNNQGKRSLAAGQAHGGTHVNVGTRIWNFPNLLARLLGPARCSQPGRGLGNAVPAVAAENERVLAAEAAQAVARDLEPVSVFISRKTQRGLVARQDARQQAPRDA